MTNGFVVARAAGVSPRRDRPQMVDVARMAGVSVASVSRALSGGHGVAPCTRARIESVARALHYEVQDSARRLRLGCNQTVGIVVCQGPDCRSALGDASLMAQVGTTADALVDQGFEVLLARAPAQQCKAVAHHHDSGRAIGLVLVGHLPTPAAQREMVERGVPFVAAGRMDCGRAIAQQLLEVLRERAVASARARPV